jgi:hypothetical protein
VTGNELFAAMLGAGASHVGGKTAEKLTRRYGLLLCGAAVVGLWWLHRRATQAPPPAGGLGIP